MVNGGLCSLQNFGLVCWLFPQTYGPCQQICLLQLSASKYVRVKFFKTHTASTHHGKKWVGMDGNSVTLPRNATIFRDAVLYRILQSINMAVSAVITLGSGLETRIYTMVNDSTIPLSIGKLSSKSVQPWKSHQETKLFQKVSTKIITNKKENKKPGPEPKGVKFSWWKQFTICTSTFQGVPIRPEGMVNWHPLGTIWHPLEGPGM